MSAQVKLETRALFRRVVYNAIYGFKNKLNLVIVFVNNVKMA